jgi:hypothetical protein
MVNEGTLSSLPYRFRNLTTTLLLAGVPLFSAFNSSGTKTLASGK